MYFKKNNKLTRLVYQINTVKNLIKFHQATNLSSFNNTEYNSKTIKIASKRKSTKFIKMNKKSNRKFYKKSQIYKVNSFY